MKVDVRANKQRFHYHSDKVVLGEDVIAGHSYYPGLAEQAERSQAGQLTEAWISQKWSQSLKRLSGVSRKNKTQPPRAD